MNMKREEKKKRKKREKIWGGKNVNK